MFICSIRAGTVRFAAVLCVALAALLTLMLFVPELQPTAAAVEETVRFEGVRTNEERVAFLKQYGWEVESEPQESTTVTIPREFDKVFAAYNELQRQEGLNLADYGGRTVERYTYRVVNYDGYDGTVLANLLVYRGRVIGGDVSSADSSGFMHGLTR